MRSPISGRSALALTLLAAASLTLAGCGGKATPSGGTPTGAATTATTPAQTTPAQTTPTKTTLPQTTPATSSGWTSGPITVDHSVPVPPVPVLVGIRTAAHSAEGYDRITFDFSGPLPGYRVGYVDKVTQDGSGLPVTAPGRRYLQIRFEPAQAHQDNGTVTVTPRSRKLDYPMMRGYVISGDFEAVLTIAIGLDDVVGYRVGELPGRVYVDVAA
jgi:hypothetical protein